MTTIIDRMGRTCCIDARDWYETNCERQFIRSYETRDTEYGTAYVVPSVVRILRQLRDWRSDDPDFRSVHISF